MTKILIIEDDPLCAKMASLMLASEEERIEIATTVEEARQLIEGQVPYDIVLSDIGLPDGDGCEFLAEVRLRPEYKKAVLAALTAHATRVIPQEKVRELGIDFLFSKPLTYAICTQLRIERETK